MALQVPRTCIEVMKCQNKGPEIGCKLQIFGTVRPVPHGTLIVPHGTVLVPHGTTGQFPAKLSFGPPELIPSFFLTRRLCIQAVARAYNLVEGLVGNLNRNFNNQECLEDLYIKERSTGKLYFISLVILQV